MAYRRNEPKPLPPITVIDVFRELRIEPVPEITWSVGAKVRDIYIAKHGEPPAKELREKTSGGGSHCFAIYPFWMKETIVDVIRQFRTEAERQGQLL